jgi:hypothetical protein
MYCIYHIPGVKIGCSSEIDTRIEQQGFNEYYILEEHVDIYTASEREIELQKQYGYKVDKIPYYRTMVSQVASRNKKSRIKAIKSRGKVNAVLSEMGKVGGKKTKESGKLMEASKKAASLPRTEKQKEHSKLFFAKGVAAAAKINRRAVLVFDKNNNFIEEYDSIVSASKAIGLAQSTIGNAINGRTPSRKYNFKFKNK